MARLGEPRIQRGDEWVFVCPKPDCGSFQKDRPKLSVNIARDQFNCWVCGFRGRNLSAVMVRGSAEYREYVGERADSPLRQPVQEKRPPCTSLPAGFIPLDRRAPRSSAPYRHYLSGRGLSEETVGLYRIGYVDTGELAGRVVIPSFDMNGSVNFWSSRTIHPDVRPAYILPDASKDVVSNEHMVDWSKPVYLVEGAFDEIAVGPQAIALYGKYLPPTLVLRLIERRPPITYVCLDNDAEREAWGIVRRLVGYDIRCAVVDLPGKDPASVTPGQLAQASLLARPISGSAGLVEARL